ncbi:MAG: serine/threonine-protein phosphatase [Chitinophagaceae bacterium]|nr:MAG: serine/threonine-protein phosphatase [Chitinophagaceae bacterium]
MLLYGNEIVSFFDLGRNGHSFLEAIANMFFFAGVLLTGNYYFRKIHFFNLEALLQNILVWGLILMLLFQLPPTLENFPFYQEMNTDYISVFLTFSMVIYLVYVLSMFGTLALINHEEKRIYWRLFLSLILLSVFLAFIPFSLPFPVYLTYYVLIVCSSIYFSFHYKWLNYLDYDAMKMVFLLFIPLNIVNAGILYFYIVGSDLVVLESAFHPNFFIYGTATFGCLYGIFSFLAVLFYFPIQKSERKKAKDIDNLFAIQERVLKKEETYDLFGFLFNSSFEACKAKAGWIRYLRHNDTKMITRNVNLAVIEKLSAFIEGYHKKKQTDSWVIFDLQQQSAIRKEKIPYTSMIYCKLENEGKMIMEIVLVSEEKTRFDQYSFQMMNTYFNQAKLAYENAELLNERLKGEVLQNELKIAQEIQISLIPEKPPEYKYIDFHAVVKQANEVGGDFYDYHINSKNELYIIIGDVTGKGLPAAIHMAEAKGIIQSLLQFDLPMEEFMLHLNRGIGICFQKNMFLTLSIIKINPSKKKFQYIRAGHCPALYYENISEVNRFLDEKGLGAGIIRNDDYKNYFKVYEQHYSAGDVILLFTDGFAETNNPANGEEFGYERIEKSFLNSDKSEAKKITTKLDQNLENFAQENYLKDDLLVIAIKFKE